MIEIMNNAGTESYARCNNMAQAQGIISYLKDSGHIPASETTVSLCQYKNRNLQEVVEVEFRQGKWRPVINRDERRINPRAGCAAAS